MREFESFYLGETASLKHKVKLSDVEKFVDLSGDDNKLHVNKEFAKLTSFSKPVVHGMIGVSFISTLIGTKIPGDGALWYKQSVEFLMPVRIGDIIEVKIEIIGINRKARSLELRTEIRNQHKQIVTTGISEVKVIDVKEDITESTAITAPIALVIGGTGGIGSKVCLELAQLGYDLAIHYYRNKDEALLIKKSIEEFNIRAMIVQFDITDIVGLSEAQGKIERSLGRVTTVINCSTSSTPNIKFANTDWNKFEEHHRINVRGAFNLVKVFLPEMIKGKHGDFIFITTQYTNSPKSELAYYISSKSALEGFVRSLAVEYGPSSVRFNLVSPGMTQTDLISDVPEKTKLLSAMNTPLRKLANAVDIANAIGFLASSKSNYITGETIRVNGGQVII
jgi:3-oxoacyl-[acyl-carrier protein] reductase